MGSLRSFKAFTNVAPVSPSVLIDALGTTTAALTRPCNLVNLDGYAAAAGWFQIFDLAVAPTTGVTVPLKSLNISAAGNLSSLLSSIGPITVNKGLYFAVSSTEAVYTAVATNFDVWGEVEEFENQLSGTTVAGDLTTGADSLQVWADAAGPRKLLRVDVINATLGVVWLMVFAKDNPVDGDFPVLPPVKLTSVTTLQTVSYGDQLGASPFERTAAEVTRDGCTLAISTTGTSLTITTNGTNNIRAYYK